MNTTTNPDLANALHALKTVNFPVVPDDQEEVDVIDWSGHGSEGYLPADLFKPDIYPIGESEFSLSYARLVHTNVDVHREAVLRKNLGYHGGRAVLDILGEALIVASERQKATLAVTAGNTLLKRLTGNPSATWLALWDNGASYNTSDELEDGFMRDGFRTLARPEVERVAPGVVKNNPIVFPTEIVAMSTAVYFGLATFVSKNDRMDVSYVEGTRNPPLYTVHHSQTESIVGNLVVARLPHVTDRSAV